MFVVEEGHGGDSERGGGEEEPAATDTLAEYGAPPVSLVPSSQVSVQLISFSKFPPPHVTVEVTVEPSGGGDAGGSGAAGGSGDPAGGPIPPRTPWTAPPP